MIDTQNTKTVVFNGPATEATNATNAAWVDTQGFNHALVEVCHGPATATNASATWTSMVLQHGDTTNATSFTALSTAGSDFTLGVHNDTSVGSVVRFNVDLRHRERYLRVVAQPTTNYNTVTYEARLTRAAITPDTAAEAGATTVVNV